MSGAASPAENERRKITAGFFNNLATVFVATGGIGPIITFTFQLAVPKSGYWPAFLVLWTVIGLGFHAVARHALKGVR